MPLDSWKTHIPIFRDEYGEKLLESVRVLRQKTVIYPDHEKVFHAFERTAFDQVKVVIVGQDPYHGQGQAHGLAFSVPQGVPAPPSLKNILKEVAEDTGKKATALLTDLSSWADQGVLLLNTLLTVEAGKPMSHKNQGWESLTSQVIAELSNQRQHLVFLLWGSKAQDFSNVIAKDSHLVLTAAHPSPLSAYRGFFGCRHFSKTNAYLKKHGINPIRW
jgi:uracil-DNA glycosylase